MGSDWPLLATELGIANKDVDRLQSSRGDEDKQALSMLQLWLKQAGIMATGRLTGHFSCHCHMSKSLSKYIRIDGEIYLWNSFIYLYLPGM